MQVMVTSRPDIAFAVGLVSRFISQPRQSHWEAVKQIMRYLKGTIDIGLTFGKSTKPLPLAVYADADYANNTDTRRSVTGYCFLLADGAVSWRSRRNKQLLCHQLRPNIWRLPRLLQKPFGYVNY